MVYRVWLNVKPVDFDVISKAKSILSDPSGESEMVKELREAIKIEPVILKNGLCDILFTEAYCKRTLNIKDRIRKILDNHESKGATK